jgi:hypothetical protein
VIEHANSVLVKRMVAPPAEIPLVTGHNSAAKFGDGLRKAFRKGKLVFSASIAQLR